MLIIKFTSTPISRFLYTDVTVIAGINETGIRYNMIENNSKII